MNDVKINYLLATRNRYYSRRADNPRRGIVVHSTGCNQTSVMPFYNSWNDDDPTVCVHAIIGNGPNGFGVYQLLPWAKYTGGCGSGPNGSYNDSHIQFEICEDNLTDPAWFKKCYDEAVKLCAYLCKLYGLGPETIVCHAEAHKLGYASNHGDVLHWFPRFGKTMNDFREDVADEMLTGEEIYNRLNEYLSAREVPETMKPLLDEAVELGITDGTRPCALTPRWQTALMVRKAVITK